MADARIEKWIKGAVGRGMNLDKVYGYQLYVPVVGFREEPCGYSLFYIDEPTECNDPVIDANSSRPLTPLLRPAYPSDARGILFPNSTITKISSIAYNTKILSSIIKRVMVNMVNVTVRKPKYHTMKLIILTVRKAFSNVKTTALSYYAPFSTSVTSFLNDAVVLSIYDYVFSSVYFRLNSKSFHKYIISNETQKVEVCHG